ncbi:YhdP family protein [Primorskyibacter sedentarius]|uniref:YhdP family protein n=1 Tax=Primorskyibacter sedentarius TaxID=745311 RepID=UPI003EBA58CD
MTDTERPQQRKRIRRSVHFASWLFTALFVLVIVAGVTAFYAVGRPIAAPDWLRDRIEQRIAQAVPGLAVEFGEVTLLLEKNGSPRLAFFDVDIGTSDGRTLASLNDLEAVLSRGALLRGTAKLKTLELAGAFLTMRRDRDGRFGLSFGDTLAPEGMAPDLPAIINIVDNALADPRLSDLQEVSANGLTLRYEDARARRGWTADGGRLTLTRGERNLSLRGDFAVLSGGTNVSTIELNAESPLGDPGLVFGVTLSDIPSRDIATQGPALAWLRGLRAPISGAMRAEMFADGSLGPLNATLSIGEGVLQPTDKTRPIPFSGARTYFTYLPETQTLSFDEISVETDWGQAVSEGRATMIGLESGWPSAMLGQFRVSDIRTNPGNFFETDLALKGAEADFRLELDPFRFSLGRMRLLDEDLPLLITGEAAAAEEGWELSVDARVKEVSPLRVEELWPPSVVPKTRKWVRDNVQGGVLHDVQFALRAEPGQALATYLGAEFEDATVQYARTLPPVTRAAGQFVINGSRLFAAVDKGEVVPTQGGALDISGSSFTIPDIRQRPSTGKLALNAKGAIPAVLALLNSEPMSIMDRVKKPVDVAQGRATVTGRLEMPLRKGVRLPDMTFDFSAALSGVSSDMLIPGRALRASSLDVRATQNEVKIGGSARLGEVPFTGQWSMPLGKPGASSRLAGRVEIGQSFADEFGITLPRGMLSGKAQADLSVTLAKDRAPEFALSSDLAGLGLRIDALNWALSQGQKGKLEVAGQLSKPARIDRLQIEGAGLSGSGDVRLNGDGSLDRIAFDRVRLGGWLDAPVVLTGRGKGAPLAISLPGGSVDMRTASLGGSSRGGGGGGATGPITLALDQLQISDGIALRPFRGTFTTGGGLSGDFTARINGRADIAGRVVPQGNGASAFRIQSQDAGKVVSSAGLLKNIAGGAMDLTLRPTGQKGTYDGSLKVSNTRLRSGNAIAALLDAISVVGLLDQMNGPGIFFSDVEAQFRLTPSQVVLSQSSATGPSMGLSLDGYYSLANKSMDFQGVISPVYILNGIGSFLTRKGEGLIGFNFTIKGTSDTPKVSVNPLSILTPGMFREIFRRPPPQTQ